MQNTSPSFNDILLYATPSGDIKIEVIFEGETFWLSQKKMAELFGKDIRTINEHLFNIFAEGELNAPATVRKFRIVQIEGSREVSREVEFYNLDAIIAVGYRVNSYQATQFRIWATRTLKEFIIKGFVLDDERLKQGRRFGKDYFDELLERIREIRASERRFYQKITDLYAQGSVDYDPKSDITQQFYKTVQNKLEWAITGKTELSALNRVVTMYLDYAENQAARQLPMRMRDWVEKLDAFLRFNEYDILQDAGKVSHEVAKALAEEAYAQFRVGQDEMYESDFDRVVKQLKVRE